MKKILIKCLARCFGDPEAERTARFRCVLAIAGPGMETETFSGSCEGVILMNVEEQWIWL